MSARVQQAVAPSAAPAAAAPQLVLRKCACGGGAGPAGECTDCQRERLDRKPRQGASRFAWSGSTGEEGAAAPEASAAPASDPVSDSAASAVPAANAAEAAPAASAGGDGAALLVEDDADAVAAGQMRKSELVGELRTAICAAADEALAPTGRNTDNCPFIEHWLGFYGSRSARYLERAIHKYVPESASATAARDYVDAVTARVRRGVERWAKTGELTDVPAGVPLSVPGDGGNGGGAAAGAAAGRGAANGGAATGEALALKARGAGRQPQRPAEIRAELGEGRRLEGGVESRMRSAFGVDFSRVHVHTDTTAAQLSNRLDARAFTVGEHVAFATGEYQPGTLVGDALLAHELAHVVQQRGAAAAGAPLAPMTSTAPVASLAAMAPRLQLAAIAPQTKSGPDVSALEADADTAAVGAVVSLWSRGRAALRDIAANAMPRLKSGLQLQRCPCKPTGAKLKINPVTGLAGLDTQHCGGVKFPIQWDLDGKTSDTEGWIVQDVKAAFDVKDCDGAPIDVLARSRALVKAGFKTSPGGNPVPKETDPAWWPFSEAWKVDGGKIFAGFGPSPHVTDSYTVAPLGPMAGFPDTKGSVAIDGTAQFFDCLTLPAAFKTGQNPIPSLPIARPAPALSGGTGALPHNIKIEWNCCKPDKTTTIVSKKP